VNRIRILLAEGHPVMRRGLRAILESAFDSMLIEDASSGRDAIHKVQQRVPAVVIMDFSLPDAMEAFQEMVGIAPEMHVLALITQDDVELARKVLQLGGAGYLLKSDSERDLAPAVRAILRGQTFLPQGSIKIFLVPEKAEEAAALSRRQRQVLQLLASGKKNREVAAALGISVRTAENHRARIMNKLKLKSFSELMRYAIRNRIAKG
jgi:two-component system response regulator NreC